MRQVIAFSGKAQNGKDTAAAYLKEILEREGRRVLITHYGDLLKYVCRAFFGWNGEKDEDGRTLLQKVGTDGIRANDPNWLARFLQDILRFFPDAWDFVLIPDCRVPNEVDDIACLHLRVVRPNFISPLTPEQQQHYTEVALDNHPYDKLIVNDGTLFELYHNLERFAADMGWIRSGMCSGRPIDERFCKTCCLKRNDSFGMCMRGLRSVRIRCRGEDSCKQQL